MVLRRDPRGRVRTYRKLKYKLTTPSKKKIVKKAMTKAKVNYIKKIVKSVVHKNVETKQAVLQLCNQSPVPGGGLQLLQNNQSGIIKPTVIPTLMQGTAVNQRIGNKVKPQSIKIKGYVRSLDYDAVTNINTRPMYAHIWLVIDKSIRAPYNKDGTQLYNNNPSNFKRNANDPVPFDGSIMNALYGYNTDAYSVLAHRRIKLDCMQPTTIVGATTPLAVVQDSINNGFVYAKPFNIVLKGRKLPKQLLYDEDDTGSGLNQCTNFNPLFYVALQNADGTLSSYQQLRFAISAQSTLYYEDA